MTCSHCQRDLQPMGCCWTSALPLYWCLYDGTFITCDGEAITPILARESKPAQPKEVRQ